MDTPKCVHCGTAVTDERAKDDVEPICPRCFLDAMGTVAPPLKLSEPTGTSIRPREVVQASPEATYGKFICTEKLGEGGMAEVWKAWDKELYRWVAIKFLKGATPKHLKRFGRESRIAGQINHPNIAAIYGVGEERGRHYIAMQFVEGDTLESMMGQKTKKIVRVIRDAARAVDFANGNGIIHRDLKPANIMVEAPKPLAPGVTPGTGSFEKRVFVMDFGLARRMEGKSISYTGEVVGTPYFMSPEQMEAKKVDARSDVYSLGATLYAIVTKHTPFNAANFSDLADLVIKQDPVRPKTYNPNIDLDLETIILKCLEKDPDRRYPTCGAFADDLDKWLSGDAIQARPPDILYQLGKRLKRNWKVVTAIGVTAILALAAFIGLVYLPRRKLRQEDRELLNQLLQGKQNTERKFADMMEAKNYDEAIRMARPKFGVTPSLPDLNLPAMAEHPDFAGLSVPYDLNLPRAFRIRGQHRLNRGDLKGRGDLANAYQLGKSQASTRGEARDAMLALARSFQKSGETEQSESAARLTAVEFGLDHPGTRAALARAMQRNGDVEGAAGLWHSIAEDPILGQEAGRALRAIRYFLPRTKLPRPRGSIRHGDFDGDGDTEFAVLAPDWTLSILRPGKTDWASVKSRQLRTEKNLPAPSWLPVDIDGDGHDEFFLFAAGRTGASLLVSYTEKDLRVLALGEGLRGVRGAAAADFDGDGRNELILYYGISQKAVRVFKVSGGTIRPWFSWDMLCDIRAFVPIGKKTFLVWLGSWVRKFQGRPVWRVGQNGIFREGPPRESEFGFRMFVIRGDDRGNYREIAEAPDRFAEGGLYRENDSTWWARAGGALWFDAVVPDLRRGLYRITWDGKRLDSRPPSRADYTYFRGSFPGHRFFWAGDEMVIAPEGEKPLPPVKMGGCTLAARKEKPYFLKFHRNEIEFFGLQEFSPPGLPSIMAGGIGTEGTLHKGQELMEIGLHEEAVEILRERLRLKENRRDRYDLGLALARLERWAEAAEEFGKAAPDRELAPDALLRQANALEQGRMWDRIPPVLEALLRLSNAGALNRKWATQRLAWCRTLGSYDRTVKWTRWDATRPLVCDVPLKARRIQESLAFFTTSDRRGEFGGGLFRYQGGALRIRIRFIPGRPGWATGTGLGFQRFEGGAAGAGILFGWNSAGASDKPTTRYQASHLSGGGHDVTVAFPAGVNLFPAEEYVAVVEYIPGFNRAFVEILDGRGETVMPARTLELKIPVDPGTYFVGWTHNGYRGGRQDGSTANETRILSMELETSTEGTGPVEPDPKDARSWYAVAGGHLVLGNHDEAEAAYGRVLNSAEDTDLRVRALLLRGLTEFRRGRVDEGRTHAREAGELDRKRVRDLLVLLRAAALTREELAFLASSAGLQ